MGESLSNLLLIIAAVVVAPLIANAIPRVKVPVVVIEIALGILIGPQVLGWAQPGLCRGSGRVGISLSILSRWIWN